MRVTSLYFVTIVRL